MLKILQDRIHQFVHQKIPDVQAAFKKGRGTSDQIVNICWITEKAREFQKNIYSCFIDYSKAFDCADHNKLWKFLRDGNTRPPYLSPRNCMQLKKQRLEPDMEQLTGSKLGNEYNRAVYSHPA